MKSGIPWEITDVRQNARDAAREAARRSGMSVGEWLDAAILDSARSDGIEPHVRAQDQERRHPEFEQPPARRRYSDHDERPRRVPDEALAEVKDRLETLSRKFDGHTRGGDDQLDAIKSRIETLSRRYELGEPRVGEGDLASVNDRLDTLSRQLDQLAYASAQIAQGSAKGDDETSRQIAGTISKLDQRLDQLIAEGRSSASEIERRVSAVDLAVAHLNREPPRAASPSEPLEQALAEIAERQRSLDGEAALPRADLPRAPTQGFDDLERQLRNINARIDTLKPCGIENGVDALRDDLAEIGLMIKEAVPRQAVEALETEVRALAERIDSKRHVGADGPAIAGVERGLAEVRDAIHALTPAENLVGFDEAVRALSHKIDGISGNGHDPAVIAQLESAIVNLRNVVSHVASNDAIAALSDEVRSLAGKFEHVASPDILAALEQRIAIIADALAAGRQGSGQDPHELHAVLQGLHDKIERLQLTRGDQTAVNALEDRIAQLLDKLDTSDARLKHLESIERGVAELLIQIEHQRAPQHAVATAMPEVDALKHDVQRTQNSIEAVHGTLGHVVDRLAMIESGIRTNKATALPKAAIVEAAQAPTPPAREFEMPAPPPSVMPARVEPAPTPTIMTPDLAPTALGNPAPVTDLHPIDPDLPPDHPIEPGATKRRNGTSPADRIAASQAALGPTRPPVIPDPGGKSNFIAAARRAAQAASAELPPARAEKGAETAGNRTSPLAASPWTAHVKSFLIAASVVAIVVGSFQLLSSLFSRSDSPPEVPPQAQPADDQPVFVPTPLSGASQPPAPAAPSAANRQSGILPGGMLYVPPSTGVVLPGEPSRQAPQTASADRVATGSVRGPGLAASPAEGTPIPPQPSTRAPAGVDKLPAGIGGAGLRAAAGKGDPNAEFEVAVRFADGRGVPQDLTAAAEWFERAAKQGLAPAQFRLGGLYEKGLGVKKDLDAARRLYSAAAQAGHAKAMHNLAVLYAEGIDGKPDYATAARWFRKAADYGVVDSQYNLGILYARGIGLEANLTEAFKWFTLAARDGDKESAKKRDDVGSRLNQPAMTEARAAAQAWTAEAQPEAATQVATPPGGWDAAPAPSAANRRVGIDAKGRPPQ